MLDGGDGDDEITNASVSGVTPFFEGYSSGLERGATGADRIDGGLGRDLLHLFFDTEVGALDLRLADASRTSVLRGTGGMVATITGVERLDFGGGGDDHVTAGNGADQLFGWRGADVLGGRGGADNLDAYDGNDTLLGGDGDDQIAGGLGDDVLAGGPGFDIVQYNELIAADLLVDLCIKGRVQNTGDGRDTLTEFEGVTVNHPSAMRRR